MSRILNMEIFDKKLGIAITIRTQRAASNIESLKRRRLVTIATEELYGVIYRAIESR